MSAKRVTVADLHRVYDSGIHNAMLYCDGCGSQNSADPNDYFLLPGDHVFKCGHGKRSNTNGRNMRLVVKRVILEDVR